MPVNAPGEYYRAEEKFRSAKTREDKILALEEMIRLLPRHHGSENMIAQLKSRLAKLRKEGESKKGGRREGVAKEGDAQICLVGYTNSGKSMLLSKLTNARPKVSETPYTTVKPEIGMMDYDGIKIQIVEIPSTFEPEYVSITRNSDLVILVSKGDDIRQLEGFLEDKYIRTKHIIINPKEESPESIKSKIWKVLDLMIVYTKKKNEVSPMALKTGSSVRDFAQRIHKDFIRNFRFARVFRRSREIKAGLNYILQDRDVVEIYTK